MGTEGHNQLESFGFWGRKFCIKNVEILSVGKIAEFAKFAGGKRRKSPDRCLFNRAKRVIKGRLLDKLALTRGRVPLIIKCTEVGINESRFVMRAGDFVGRESGVQRFSQNR